MKRPLNRDIINYYSARAEYYEERDVSSRRKDVTHLRKICRDLVRGREVLELACGTGIWTSFIARFAGSLLATDINLTMLQMAKQRIYKRNNVSFSLADAYNLSSIRCKFTAGFAGWWLSHVDKTRMRSFLEGFHEKLAPGSIVIFMDDTHETMDITSSTDEYNNAYTIRTLKDGSTHEIIKNVFNEANLKELIAGIAYNIKVYSLTYHWLLSYNVLHPPVLSESKAAQFNSGKILHSSSSVAGPQDSIERSANHDD